MSNFMELQTRRRNIEFVLGSLKAIDPDIREKLIDELNRLDEQMEAMLLEGYLKVPEKGNWGHFS